MIKKIICLGVILIMCLGILSGCGKNYKIDVGGEIIAGKIPATCQTRVMLNSDIFYLEDKIVFSVGFGLLPGSNNEGYEIQGATIVLSIESQGFIITNAENSENDLYEKEFKEYSDNKFVCTKKRKRYIPNYYETFELKLNSERTGGKIQISAVLHSGEFVSGRGEGIYYAADNDRIAFSAKSIENAQKKL